MLEQRRPLTVRGIVAGMRTLLVAAALLLAACKGDSKSCSISVGSCAPGAELCGLQAACKKSNYQLACTPPADNTATQIDCKCVENGVIGKTVQITYPLRGDAKAVMKSACGFEL